VESLKERNHFEDLDVMVNSKHDLKDLHCESVYWIHLSQDKTQLWTAVSTVVLPLKLPGKLRRKMVTVVSDC
jgi:hypothetical protein